MTNVSVGSESICQAGIHVVRTIVRAVNNAVEHNPDRALEYIDIGVRKKRALRIDVIAEDRFEDTLQNYHRRQFSHIKVHGEETLRSEDFELKSGDGPCVLVDAVDGTDLVERFMGNWCTAAVFYNPDNKKGNRIIAAVVGLPNLDVYFATADRANAWVQRPGRGILPVEVAGSTDVSKIADSSVCFYGQKPKRLLEITRHKLCKPTGPAPFRVYTLAGIPMMMKLIDHRVKVEGAHGIDAVFEVAGQKPHDVVPGAFIAIKAGAIMRDLNGKRLYESDLEESLLRPAAKGSELRYVMAGTDKLCKALRLQLVKGTKLSRAPR